MSAVAPAPVEPQPEISQPARIVNAFIAPSKAFAGLDRKPQWWMAFLLILVLSGLFMYSMDKKIGWDTITKQEMAKNPRAAERLEQLSPEQRDRAMENAAKVSKVVAYVAGTIGVLLVFVIIAAVLMATFSFGLGSKVSFGTALAIVIYGWMPNALGGVIGMLSLWLGANPEGFNYRNPVASNPAAWFMDPTTTSKALYSLGTLPDIFSLWVVALLGIGFAANTKVKKSTAIIVVLVWFLVYKLGQTGFAAMS